MRTLLWIAALSTTFISTTAYGIDLCRCLGLDCIVDCDHNQSCGSCCETGCGCEAGCGCEGGCGCDAGCGCDVGCCEPACGTGAYCANGRSYAGQRWDCCCESGPRLCPCTDECGNCCSPDCCFDGLCDCDDSCGCGDACGGCEPACGCGQPCGCGDCCEPACGSDVGCCEPACGCGSGCGPGNCVGKDWFGCGIFACIGNCLCGCSGCDSEVYWSEWHNDPPRCCDPCDRCGNWVGPGAGYRAPYDHPYASHSGPSATQYANKARAIPNAASAAIAKKRSRAMAQKGRTVRRPDTAPAKTNQR